MDGLHSPVLEGQEGKELLHLPVDLGALREDLLLGHGKEARFRPGHGICRLLEHLGKVRRHGSKVLRGHRLGIDAGVVLKTVGVILHAPQGAKSAVHRQHGAHGTQYGAVSAVSPAALGPDHRDDAPDEVCRRPQGDEDAQHLHDGEVHPVAKAPQKAAEGGDDLIFQGVHPRPVSPDQAEKAQKGQLCRKPEV